MSISPGTRFGPYEVADEIDTLRYGRRIYFTRSLSE